MADVSIAIEIGQKAVMTVNWGVYVDNKVGGYIL